jgi:hypothetical protein
MRVGKPTEGLARWIFDGRIGNEGEKRNSRIQKSGRNFKLLLSAGHPLNLRFDVLILTDH